jgi:hypothetical protein
MPFDPTAFANAESDFNRDDPPAPGEYEVELTETDIISAKDGRQFAKVVYKVVSGFARDHVWGVVHTLDALNRDGEPNGGLAITKQTLRELGVEVDMVQSIVDLRHALDGIQGKQYVVEVSRNGQYVNTKPKRALNGASSSPPPAASSYGQQAAPPAQGSSNAIYGGDGPSSQPQAQSQGMLGPDEVRREPERTGQSDVPGPQPGDFEHPPQKGDLDPETGEPIPF